MMKNRFLLFFGLISLLFVSLGPVSAQDDDANLPKPSSMDSADADNPGMPWLDLATDEKLRAQDINDFGKVIGLCRRARKEGLAGNNLTFCDQLRAAAQLQRGLITAQELLGRPVSALPKDWDVLRLRTLADLEEAITVVKDQPAPYIRISQLNANLPNGDTKRAAEVLDLALENIKESDPNAYVEIVVLRASLEKDPIKRGEFITAKAKDGTNTQLLLIHVVNLIEQKQNDAALSVLQRILDLEPDNLKALGVQFDLLTNKKEFEEATKVLDKIEKLGGDEDVLLQRVQLYAQMRKYTEAVALLDDLRKKNPENPKILYLRSLLYVEMKDYDMALKDVDAGYRLFPDNPNFLLQKINILTIRKQYDDALKITDDLIKDHPDNIDFFRTKLQILLAQKLTDQAIAVLDEISAKQPTEEKWTLLKIQILCEAKKYEEAVDLAEELHKKNPEEDRWMYTKIKILNDAKKFDDSIAFVEELEKKSPDEKERWGILKIQILSEAKKYEEAIKIADDYLKEHPDQFDFLLSKLQIFLVQKLYDKSIVIAEELCRKNPDDEKWILLKVQILSEAKKQDEALTILEELHKKAPDKIDITFNIVSVLSLQKKNRKALKYLTPLLEKEPDNIDFIKAQSQILISLNRFDDAIKVLEAIIKADPEDETSINNLSWILSTSPIDSIRNGKRALELAEQAAKLTDYKKSYILSTLAAAYAELGDFDKALEWSQKSIDMAKEDDNVKDRIEDLQKELDSYKNKKPYRETTPEENE